MFKASLMFTIYKKGRNKNMAIEQIGYDIPIEQISYRKVSRKEATDVYKETINYLKGIFPKYNVQLMGDCFQNKKIMSEGDIAQASKNFSQIWFLNLRNKFHGFTVEDLAKKAEMTVKDFGKKYPDLVTFLESLAQKAK